MTVERREENLDVLRVISSFMVVLIHVSAIYVSTNINNYNYDFKVGNFFDSISRISVPLFVMISGAFLINNEKNKNFNYFMRKTINKIVVPTLIWSAIYVLYSILIQVFSKINGENINYISPFIQWIKGEPYYHMWYMYMLIGLYFVTPFIIEIKDKIGKVNFIILAIILLIIGFLTTFIGDLPWPIRFISYLGYFCLGDIIKNYCNKNFSYKIYLFIGISFLFLIFIFTNQIVKYNLLNNKLYFYNYLNPLVIIASISIFKVFTSMKDLNCSKLISNISKHTFNIYMIHAGIINCFNLIINNTLDRSFNPMWFIPFFTIVVYLICYYISKLILKMQIVQKVKANL
ncbi:acyltransferase [Clostridium perfringens]|uniref:acyltransferase n=1 Tax=Clostridium perfringens TaxID=1502 RepID=UPI00210AC1B1|nr:acyltransferase family protein [Clostridium perfringens]